VEELHSLGFRGLGELEFVKKSYNDPSYFPVYELANRYGWLVLFHTGIVLRRNFDEPEDVASGRMRPIHLEEIARRFPKSPWSVPIVAIPSMNGQRRLRAGTRTSFST